uniref:Uncharacterized protein n=1 Tax=Hyaloperonospora arabidopsidis (strain Emoy2) TaxID=559515 RepID=M4B253_HYAAE
MDCFQGLTVSWICCKQGENQKHRVPSPRAALRRRTTVVSRSTIASGGDLPYSSQTLVDSSGPNPAAAHARDAAVQDTLKSLEGVMLDKTDIMLAAPQVWGRRCWPRR